MKLTKIVCTIGPTSGTKEKLGQLIDAGMNVARLNFSHGEHGEKGEKIAILRELMFEKKKSVGLLLDTKGPEIRTGKLEGGIPIQVHAGNEIRIVYEDILGTPEKISMTYKHLHEDMQPGMQILIADGAVVFQVKEILGKDVVCLVTNTCELGERKNVNLPGVKVQLPVLEQKDIDDLIFGCAQGVDFVAASFIRKASDVKEIRELLTKHNGAAIKIISKIENQEGLDNFEEILAASDGIMVARGDLGMEIPMEELPLVQKMMIRRCNEVGKIVITATQMLDSMIKNPRPTRAEVTDVANAILDGTDAVMLSGETANGLYPVASVDMMARICRTTDPHVRPHENVSLPDDMSGAIAKGAVHAAQIINARCIVTTSITGKTAMLLRKLFPSQQIVVLTYDAQVARQVCCIKGCEGFVVEPSNDYEHLYATTKEILLTQQLAQPGDNVVITSGRAISAAGTTNMLKIITI